jgi:3-oxoacyl-[acyl-carrier-protein] synthase II
MKSAFPKVVITGFGATTALGSDVAGTWLGVSSGKTAAGPVEHFETKDCRCKFAAVVKEPNCSWLNSKQQKRLSRASRLALPAAREALAMANLLKDGKCTFSVLPMSVSSTGGGMGLGETFLKKLYSQKLNGSKRNRLFCASRYQSQQQALDLHESFNFSGPTTIVANACASGANAIGNAADFIRMGKYDCVLTGGWEELAELLFVGFDSLQALSPECCRPFDMNRNGLMLGEAAGFLVLESETHAKNRGAEIFCELNGYGHSTDIYHLTQPEPSGVALNQAIHMALKRSTIKISEIGYLNAHGTGTVLNDGSECSAFKKAFGENMTNVRMSSTKSSLGHTLGAAGSVEAILSIQALRTGQLPPQTNLKNPEPLVATNLVREGENRQLQAVLSTNLGFGGSNAALIFSKYDA